jgi:hypothetical protein
LETFLNGFVPSLEPLERELQGILPGGDDDARAPCFAILDSSLPLLPRTAAENSQNFLEGQRGR